MRHSLVVLVTVCLCAYMWKDLPNELHRGVPMVLDAYSRGLLVRYATSHPDATEMVPPSFTGPTVQVPVELVMNVTVTVPESVDPLDTYAATLYAGILPFPDSAADCGAWNLNDRVPPQVVLADMLWPRLHPHRTLVPSHDKYTDRALSDLMFTSTGQHRLEAVRASDVYKGDAVYASYMGDAEQWHTRPGFAKLGADAYFDAHGTLLFIRRLQQTFRPTDMPTDAYRFSDHDQNRSACIAHGGYRVRGWLSETCGVTRGHCTALGGTRVLRDCHVPAQDRWTHAKMAFRGTLSVMVTCMDHLYALHLVVSNALVTASTEILDVSNPIRRLMHPFTFRTIDSNYHVAHALVNEYGLLHRASALNTVGLKQLYAFARTGIAWSTIPERHAAQGMRLRLPLHEDGGDFYAVIQEYVRVYLQLHYTEHCSADPPLRAWWARLTDTMTPNRDLPPLSNCTVLSDVLATVIYLVTAGHHHVGAILADVEDPCHSPWAFRDHELCGLPRTSLVQLLTFAIPSGESPKLLRDYSQVFLDGSSKYAWSAFQRNLTAFQSRVSARNAKRARPFHSFDLNSVEISVG